MIKFEYEDIGYYGYLGFLIDFSMEKMIYNPIS